jgi:phosphoribosylanthranilate isomerase
MKLKVCGMKYVNNIQEVVNLQSDYLGFIFYEKSKRNFEGIIPELPKSVKKTGVFVNEHIEIVISLVEEYQLDALQLHGDESVAYIKELQSQLAESNALLIEENKYQKKKKNNQFTANKKIEIIKVFGIKDAFNFDDLKPYLEVVDYFLFDTKGKERGGNGVQFDWSVLDSYPYEVPFFLSGGIGLKELDSVRSFLDKEASKYCYALDVNSKFEIEPGKKDIVALKKFKQRLAV